MMSDIEGTIVSLFTLMDYCEKCKHCQKLDRHDYHDKVFEDWQCKLLARKNLIVRLNDNRVQYAYTDDSAAFTFLNHKCPHFIMASMESDGIKPTLIGIDRA